MTPGPTQVPEAARLAMAREVIHHRSPEFKADHDRSARRAEIDPARPTGDVILLTASGSGGMEAAVTSTVPRGGKAIVLEGGVFARALDAHLPGVRHRGRPARDSLGPGGRSGRRRPAAQASIPTRWRCLPRCWRAAPAWCTMSKRSAGWWPRRRRLLVVDAISGAGSLPCHTDRWKIDVLVVGSQKALMLPPGLAIDRGQPESLAANRRHRSRRPFISTCKHYRKMLPETPWTPAISLVVGLAESLRQIRSIGIERVWARVRDAGPGHPGGGRGAGARRCLPSGRRRV